MLIYSPLLGLREEPSSTIAAIPGVYVKKALGWEVCRFNSHVRHGSSFDWVSVHRDQLPRRLRTEALILGIAL